MCVFIIFAGRKEIFVLYTGKIVEQIKKSMKIFKIIAATTLSLGLVFTACNKEEEGATAEVHVVTEKGALVPNALVYLDCESSKTPPQPCNIHVEGVADENGIFIHEFKQPSVLKITAFKIYADTQVLGVLPDTTLVITRDSLCGESFISVLEGEASKQTVVLYECN